MSKSVRELVAEAKELLEKAIQVWPICNCIEAWTARNLHNPDCAWAESSESKEYVDQALCLLSEPPKCQNPNCVNGKVPTKQMYVDGPIHYVPCPDCQPDVGEFVKRLRENVATTDVEGVWVDKLHWPSIKDDILEACALLEAAEEKNKELEKDLAAVRGMFKSRGEDMEHIERANDNQRQTIAEQAKRIEELEQVIADVKLELSTPETAGMDKEPLYKWAATLTCAHFKERQELEAKNAQQAKTIEQQRKRIEELKEGKAISQYDPHDEKWHSSN
jgi:hypothetical protein